MKDDTRASGMCHDPNALYRPDAKVFKVEPDKVTVGEVWKRIEASLSDNGYAYEPGRHNEYISQAGYLLNRYGVDEGDAVEWMQRITPDYDPNRTESHVRSCYSTRAEEHGTLRPGNRPKSVLKKKPTKQKAEQPKYISVEEIEACLTDRPGGNPHALQAREPFRSTQPGGRPDTQALPYPPARRGV